jgi:hypothetical protein
MIAEHTFQSLLPDYSANKTDASSIFIRQMRSEEANT